MPFNVTSAGLFQVDENGVFYFDDECCCEGDPTNTCGECDPPLYEQYTATITGVGAGSGDGTHILNQVGTEPNACRWFKQDVGFYVDLQHIAGLWYVSIQGFITWSRGQSECSGPEGVYTGSTGTCVVS